MNAKRGRPPFPVGTAKSETLLFRLTAKELNRLKREARKEDMTVSELARERVLHPNGLTQKVLDHIKRLAARTMEAERRLEALEK